MKKRCTCILLALLLSLATVSGFAHSGRTDSAGGHRDNKNKSGLGSYHYHCGGHPAHLHTNGVCPYSSGAKAKPIARPTAKPVTKATTKPTEEPSGVTSEEILAVLNGNRLALANGETVEVTFGMTNAKGVNIREEANTRAKKVGGLPRTGTPVVVLEKAVDSKDKAWYRVFWLDHGKEFTGWIIGDYIDEITQTDFYNTIKKAA